MIRTPMRRAALLLAGLLLTSCASASPTTPAPDPGILVANHGGEDIRVEIIDQTGWLLRAAATLIGGGTTGAHVANPPGESQVLVVQWIGGACERHRSVILKDNGGQLFVVLNRGSVPDPVDGHLCADVALWYEVRLEFDRNVRAERVGLELLPRSSVEVPGA